MNNTAAQSYNRSCPEPVSCVRVTQNTITLGSGRAEVITEKLCSTTNKIFEMSHDPAGWLTPKVFVNGVLQLAPDHYAIEGRFVTFVFPLSSDDDVQVEYAALLECDEPAAPHPEPRGFRAVRGFKKPCGCHDRI